MSREAIEKAVQDAHDQLDSVPLGQYETEDGILRSLASTVRDAVLEEAMRAVREKALDPRRRIEYVMVGAMGLNVFAGDVLDAIRALKSKEPAKP